jgi:hypothetical protein
MSRVALVVQGTLHLPQLEAATIMNNYGWELYRIFAMFVVFVGLGLQIISVGNLVEAK